MSDYKSLYVATEKIMNKTIYRWADMLCGRNTILSDWCLAISVQFYSECIRGGRNCLTLKSPFEVKALNTVISIYGIMNVTEDVVNITKEEIEIKNVNWFFRELVKLKDIDTSVIYSGGN